MDTLENLIKEKITSIPDFPKKGIIFRDVTTLIEDKEAFGAVISAIAWNYRKSGTVFDKVAGPEARGVIVGAPVAYALNAGLVLVRKPGKLPREVYSESYDLEYGSASIEIHRDSIKPGEHVLLADDLIATGGTAEAAVKLIRKAGGIVDHAVFLINLPDLGGVERLKNLGVESLTLASYTGA